ncbi:MAG: hypothetical protein R2792_02590 [Saprospiraceae bacterium]
MEDIRAQRKAKALKGVSILNGFLFLLSGVGFIEKGKLLFGFLQILASALNLRVAFMKSPDSPAARMLNRAIGIMNILIPISIAVDYIQSDSKYIHFAWIFVALLSLFVFIRGLRAGK